MRSRLTRSAFTLVEMLVSVALVVVLMLAVTQIFSIASRTISGAQAIGAAVRDAQAAQAVLSHDFGSIATDTSSPAIIIRSKRVAAFRNQDDFNSAIDQTDPLKDDTDHVGSTNVVYTVPGETYSPLIYNFRNHRTDYTTFFARDRFPRQTGGSNPASSNDPLIANQTANEAAIYLHHAAVADNSTPANYIAPGAGNPITNPNNFFASQWTLSRVAMLMVSPTAGVINDLNGTPQMYYAHTAGTNLTPLASSAVVSQARYDLAGISMSDFNTVLQSYSGGTGWQIGKAYAVDDMVLYTNTKYRCVVANVADSTNPPPGADWVANGAATDWYTPLMCDSRFHINPFGFRPVTASTVSQQVPIFLPACTQFIVEFAGDFVTQDPTTGQVTAAVPDGKIDTVYNPSLAAALRDTKQIRWYGLPRDTNGDGLIRANDGDVVPVCDVARIAMPFEHYWPITGATAPSPTPTAPTAQTPIVTPDVNYYGLTTAPADPQYIVAWGPGDTNRPKLIRITIVIDRPEAAGNLLDGQSFEYVFKVGL